MNKVIRWPGAVSFAAIVLLVALFFMVFLDGLVKSGLSSLLTRINKAEVNIAQVELQWSPFTVHVEGLEMTDPGQPTHNRFEAETIQAQVRVLDLFIGKVHIEDLTAEGIQVGSKRLQAGHVTVNEAVESEPVPLRERLAEYNIELPTAESFLAGADIQTPELVEQVEQDFKERRAEFEQAREQLPTKDALESYKTRIEGIIDSKPKKPREIIAAREALKEIKAEMRRDKQRVEDFLEVSKTIVAATEEDIAAVRATYQADIDRAKALFQLDPESLTALSGILFGEQVEAWANYGLVALDVIAPLMKQAQEEETQKPSRWEGRYIDFDTQRSPDFWVKRARLGMQLESLSLMLSVDNITWQHERIGTPTTYKLLAEQGANWESFDFRGELFINNAGQVSAEQLWQLEGVNLNNLELSGNSALFVNLASAKLNTHGSLVLNSGEFDGQSAFQFEQADFEVNGDTAVVSYLGEALNHIRAFDLDLDVAGKLSQPRLSLSSNLDRQLGAQLNASLQSEASARLEQVKQSLSEHSDGVLAQVGPWLEQAQALHAEGKGIEETFTELLETEVENLIDTERERLLERLKGKLGES